MFLSFLFPPSLFSQINKDMKEQNKLLQVAESYKNKLSKEVDYKVVLYLKDKINKDVVHIFRFEPEPSSSVTIYGPHITVILDDNEKLKGFARLSENMTGENNINEKDGKALALSFLRKYAPDLRDADYQWTKSHQETLTDGKGNKKVINGKWVKYREENTGQYLWVILAPDRSIMEFDRDIVWSFFRGGRVNELWLRDEWFGKWFDKNKK